MMYQGGKSRLVKHFAPILTQALETRGGRFWEPFVGGFNVIPALGPAVRRAICGDTAPGLVQMYKHVVQGLYTPKAVSEAEYNRLRKLGGTDPHSTFVSYGCSFAGKRWGGYARDKTGKRNLGEESARRLIAKIPHLQKVLDWWVLSYVSYQPDVFAEWVIYCDPPYNNTTGYSAEFDTEKFRNWCERMADLGHRVFVSEFDGVERPRWRVIWSKSRPLSMNRGQAQPSRLEVLMEVR